MLDVSPVSLDRRMGVTLCVAQIISGHILAHAPGLVQDQGPVVTAGGREAGRGHAVAPGAGPGQRAGPEVVLSHGPEAETEAAVEARAPENHQRAGAAVKVQTEKGLVRLHQ